jgi:hypothetical protein
MLTKPFPVTSPYTATHTGANHEPIGVGKRQAAPALDEDSGNESDEEVVAQHQVLGQYNEDGVVYLQGRWHEDVLVVGRECQVMPPDSDDWVAGVIKRCSVSDESMQAQLEYTVALMSDLGIDGIAGGSDAGTKSSVVVVDSEDLRIAAPSAPPKPAGFDKVLAHEHGFGVWESVPQQFDDEPEELADATELDSSVRHPGEDALDFAMRQEREMRERQRAQAAGYDRSHPDYAGGDVGYEGDDSYSAANPFGGAYRGFEMPEEESVRVVSSIENAGM